MPSRPYKTCLLLLCLACVLACGTDGGTASTTETIELRVLLETLGPSDRLDVQDVEYSIVCVGDEDSAEPDEIRWWPGLEVSDGQSVTLGMLEVHTETWSGYFDLPHGPCSLQLRARDNDGDFVCATVVRFSVEANAPAQLIVPFQCERNRVHEFGVNRCPELLALRCGELDPMTDVASCELSFRDEDNTCNGSCDPQTCMPSSVGLMCSPGPDPGVSTTITCTESVLDCTGDGIRDPSCTIDSSAEGVTVEADHTRVADFFVGCIRPGYSNTPTETITCTAVTTDGDHGCDTTRLVTLNCPDWSP